MSTKNPNLFKRVYEEIKYLAKTFAGTKQGAALEKVKNTFAEMYRDVDVKNTAHTDGVKYSLVVKKTDGTETLADPAKITRSEILGYMDLSLKQKLDSNTYFPVRANTPETILATLEGAGVKISDKPIAMQAKKARQSQREGVVYSSEGYVIRGHAMKPEQIMEVIDNLGNATEIVQETELTKTVVIDGVKTKVPIPDRFVAFVPAGNGNEYVAVLQFDSDIDPKYLVKDGHGDEYHTTITVFEPDIEVDGEPFDYFTFLTEKDTNYALRIIKESPQKETAIARHLPQSPNEELSNDSIRNPDEKVNGKFSLSETKTAESAGGYRITGEDIALAPTREDIAEQERIATAQNAPRNDAEELGAPTREDIARMEQEKKLKGPLQMKDSLDRELEKLYRLQQTGKIQDDAYFMELSKVNEAYQASGRDFTEAFGRVVNAYQGEAEMQAAVADKNSHISLEEYANNESPVWRNVAYNDDATKASIMQATHDAMVAEGSVVAVTQDVMDTVEQSFPDLRSMKKKERTPILKEAINKLKNNIRQFLTGLSNQNFEFEINGKVLDAKLYSTGINEVLEKVTQEKANMLYSTEEIFRNARYLYSTPDYDGDPNVYRWNYFYTPVQIGDETVGVRIAVRDVATPRESQIYNWGIKKDASLDGVGRGTNNRISHGASSDASNNSIPEDVSGVKYSLSESVAEEIGAPTREDILRMEAEKELHGPWRMTDALDQRVEKLYRMMLREEVSEEDYIAQLVKADRQYQQRGSKVEEALERVREAYRKETTETPETEKKMERLTRKVLHKGGVCREYKSPSRINGWGSLCIYSFSFCSLSFLPTSLRISTEGAGILPR